MTYGIIENGQCVNAIEADESVALSLGAIEIPDGYWIGDYYDGEWHHDKPETIDNRVKMLETTIFDMSTEIEQLSQISMAIERGLNL